MADVDATPAPHVEQTVTFNDATQSVQAEAPAAIDNSYAISGDGEVTLGSFLARPVRIHTFDWLPSTPLTTNFNPWYDFLTNPLVIDKWRHYAYLRGNLKIKIVINGSPFYYGRAIVGYLPLDNDNVPFKVLSDHAQSGSDYSDDCRVNYLSQCQCAYIDPSTLSSVEMELPFICPRNALRMYKLNNSGGADVPVSQLTDFLSMGRLHFHQINALRQGNTPEAGVEARVSVTVFAWMDNVELSVPTDQNVTPLPATLRFQGKRTKVNMMTGEKEEDQAVKGTVSVSGVASAFEDSLSRLSMVPIIGPFATAGSIASGAMSRIAKVFGYSRPNQLGDTMYYQPEPLPKFASTTGAFLGAKLALDPLNEVTIDPRVGNFDTSDQLSIESFAKQESFLTSFTWTQNGSGSGFNTLFRCAVVPTLYTIAPLQSPPVGKAGRLMQPTALAFASNPFGYWRGTLKVRFQVVASQYHRGRLAVAYEPNIGQQRLLNGQDPPDYNGRKIQIFDLQEFDGVEIEFPWAQSEMFCRMPPTDFLEPAIGTARYAYTPSYNNLYTPVLGAGDGQGFANGFFEVIVVNDLTAAIPDPPPISINVFVSMEDLEVACPNNNPIGSPAYVVPAFKGASDEPSEDDQDNSVSLKYEADAVTGKFDHDMGMKTEMLTEKTVDQVFQIGFGERIKSFRSLLKRPQTLFFLNGDGAEKENYLYCNAIPRNYRYYPLQTVPDWMSLKKDYEIDLFSYLRGAFVGMRGGFRYSIIPYNNEKYLTSMSVNRYQSPDSDPIFFAPLLTFGSAVVDYLGTHYALMKSNPALNFECPYYDTSRFLSAQGNDLKGDTIYPHTGQVEKFRVGVSSDIPSPFKLMLTAVPADDFTFIGRVGAPPVIHLWDT